MDKASNNRLPKRHRDFKQQTPETRHQKADPGFRPRQTTDAYNKQHTLITKTKSTKTKNKTTDTQKVNQIISWLPRFQSSLYLATSSMSVILSSNTLTVTSPSVVVALLSTPGEVNVTSNSLEQGVRARHGHHGYMLAEHGMARRQVEHFVMLEPPTSPSFMWANTFVLKYLD